MRSDTIEENWENWGQSTIIPDIKRNCALTPFIQMIIYPENRTDILMEQRQSSRNTDSVTIFKQVGPLRLLFAALVVFCLLLVFFPDGDGTGWYVLSVHVAPALVILIIWVLLFDLLMASIFMSQKHGQERLRYRHILLWDGFLLVALFAFWGPYFASLLNQ
jgi:hypothetical protein